MFYCRLLFCGRIFGGGMLHRRRKKVRLYHFCRLGIHGIERQGSNPSSHSTKNLTDQMNLQQAVDVHFYVGHSSNYIIKQLCLPVLPAPAS